MAQFSIEVWSLTSPAARHEDRLLTGSLTVEARGEDDARTAAARALAIPRDYWFGARASAVGLRYATRWRRGTRGEAIPEEAIVGHTPYVILRVEAARVQRRPQAQTRAAFNAPRMAGAR